MYGQCGSLSSFRLPCEAATTATFNTFSWLFATLTCDSTISSSRYCSYPRGMSEALPKDADSQIRRDDQHTRNPSPDSTLCVFGQNLLTGHISVTSFAAPWLNWPDTLRTGTTGPRQIWSSFSHLWQPPRQSFKSESSDRDGQIFTRLNSMRIARLPSRTPFTSYSLDVLPWRCRLLTLQTVTAELANLRVSHRGLPYPHL
ncbi:hypothetical protein BT63DRAFT_461441 [Microthyrium microscopicum]|uniref:Uncharacterized protein n=1 Tax=Microthyrium microscopicum TaxID=703497 RepID=A0A6A6TU29_9PEZI|nr:hypothetical protein BT63DRAFT_461441 [Microthyrium microscopicum]